MLGLKFLKNIWNQEYRNKKLSLMKKKLVLEELLTCKQMFGMKCWGTSYIIMN
jgi:hypothetical protein